MHFKRRQAHTVRTWRTTLQGVDGSRIARWASIIPPSKPPEIAIGSQAALIIEQLSVLPPVNCNGHITLLQIGSAHVWTPVTNAHLVCRLPLEKKKHIHTSTTV